MKKAVLALLLTAAGVAHAAPVSVTFTYEGANFTSQLTPLPEWIASAKLEASFTGEDLNRDNVITANELTSLYANGVNYLTPNSVTDYYSVTNFRYRSTSDYSIAVAFNHYYDPDTGQQGWAHGNSASWSPTAQQWLSSNDNEWDYFQKWNSTSETVVHVVSSVPEPTTIAMLGLGLAVIGIARRRSTVAS